MKKLIFFTVTLFSITAVHAFVYLYSIHHHRYNENNQDEYQYIVDYNNTHEKLNNEWFYYDEPRMWPYSIFFKEPLHFLIRYHECEGEYHIYEYKIVKGERYRVGVRKSINNPKEIYAKLGVVNANH